MERPSTKSRFLTVLTFGLVISIGYGVHQWFLVQQDEEIAPRERAVEGTVYEVIHHKGDTAHYSFTYEGKQYLGSEETGPDQCACETMVYLDPTNPSMNTLTEYRIKLNKDRSLMFTCGYASLGFAAALASAWWFNRETPNSTQIGQSQTS
jgi:hypothetical protein